MTDKSAFTEDEWKALTEAPLLVTVALYAVGEHGPVSTIKEASASARAIAHPAAGGPADGLIAEIAKEAEGKEARHDALHARGATLDQLEEAALADLGAAATALRKLPKDEGAQVGRWFVDIARAVAAAAKSTNPAEQEAIEKIAALFEIPTS